jgi:hypothetical protein
LGNRTARPLARRSTEERLTLYKAGSTPVESFRITRLQGHQTQPHLLELPQKCSGLATEQKKTPGGFPPGGFSIYWALNG